LAKRKSGVLKNEESFIKDYKDKFETLYSYELKDSQFIFVNNGVQDDEYAKKAEKDIMTANL